MKIEININKDCAQKFHDYIKDNKSTDYQNFKLICDWHITPTQRKLKLDEHTIGIEGYNNTSSYYRPLFHNYTKGLPNIIISFGYLLLKDIIRLADSSPFLLKDENDFNVNFVLSIILKYMTKYKNDVLPMPLKIIADEDDALVKFIRNKKTKSTIKNRINGMIYFDIAKSNSWVENDKLIVVRDD